MFFRPFFYVWICFDANTFPSPDLSADDLLIQVLPEHLQLRHGLLDGAAVGLLRHLLQQEAWLVVKALHFYLQLVSLSFELLKHTQWYTQSVNSGTKPYGQYTLNYCRRLFNTRSVFLWIKYNATTLRSSSFCNRTKQANSCRLMLTQLVHDTASVKVNSPSKVKELHLKQENRTVPWARQSAAWQFPGLCLQVTLNPVCSPEYPPSQTYPANKVGNHC